MRTSFHHQPEAQHPNSSAIHKLVGRLTHLLGVKRTLGGRPRLGHVKRLTQMYGPAVRCKRTLIETADLRSCINVSGL